MEIGNIHTHLIRVILLRCKKLSKMQGSAQLPYDIQKLIASYITCPADRIAASLVCRYWRDDLFKLDPNNTWVEMWLYIKSGGVLGEWSDELRILLYPYDIINIVDDFDPYRVYYKTSPPQSCILRHAPTTTIWAKKRSKIACLCNDDDDLTTICCVPDSIVTKKLSYRSVSCKNKEKYLLMRNYITLGTVLWRMCQIRGCKCARVGEDENTKWMPHEDEISKVLSSVPVFN